MLERVNTTPPAIEVHGLSKHFGKCVAIENLSIRVRFGEIHGLAGANGGGKSTSLRLLAGLLAPDAGTAKILGYSLPWESKRVRHSVGYVPQRNWLYSTLSVRENLRFRAAIFGVKSPARAAELQMEAFGLNAYARTPVGNLSGGWSRLTELAAALIHCPRVLLLDEPTVGLDPAARQDIWRRLTSLAARGTAIVLSTHDLAEAQRCSDLVLLSEGRVKAQGAPHNIPRQLEVMALVVAGQGALAVMDAIPPWLVMAAYPNSNGLRLVIARERVPEVEGRLAALGYLTQRTGLSLEDAALAVACKHGERP
jgi:ABC-2 type transport system ATP-binding protein